MPCHGDPLLYPTAELGGLFLAALFLLALWKTGESAFQGLLLVLVLTASCWFADLALPTGVLLSGVSKAGQGYLLLQSTVLLLRRSGLEMRGCCC